MNVRMYEPADHPIFADWWTRHKFPVMPEVFLPNTGIIVEREGVPLAGGFIYMDDSCAVCMLEWVVTNPDNKPRESLKALTMLYDFAGQLAKDYGRGIMLTAIKQPALGRLLEKVGFIKSDSEITHYIKPAVYVKPTD